MFRSIATASVLLFAAGLMTGARADDMTLRTLNVSGHGEVRQAPDIAMVSAGVVKQADTAEGALAANSAAMQQVIASLKSAGVDVKDIQTSNFSVQPRYDYGDNQPPKLLGYEVQNSVNFSLRNVGTLGAVLDKLVSAGANQITGVSFDVADPAASLDAARKLAVEDAKHKAQVYAAAAGITLGPIVSLSEDVNAPGPVPIRATMAKGAPPNVPIAEGQHVVAVDVNIGWSLK